VLTGHLNGVWSLKSLYMPWCVACSSRGGLLLRVIVGLPLLESCLKLARVLPVNGLLVNSTVCVLRRLLCMRRHQASFLVSGSSDETVRVWSLATGSCVRVLEGTRV
jgi:WD40 repeat protein